jgi:hypothetical protein
MRLETIAIHAGGDVDPATGSVRHALEDDDCRVIRGRDLPRKMRGADAN